MSPVHDACSLAPPTRRHLLMASAAFGLAAGSARAAGPASGSDDPFIERLLRRMTLEEKAGQLTLMVGRGAARLVNPQTGPTPQLQAMLDDVAAGRVSGVYNGDDVAFSRRLQQIAVERSRLKIPLIFSADILHGHTTAFPVPVGEAASFDEELCRRTARAAALEATASGVQWTFAPMVDVARDQRWGRVVEGAGEDPWLGSRIAAARVRGFQGDDLRAEDSLLACPKHFAAYGAVQGGMDYNSADIPQATLRAVHLPPFQAAFDAGALTTMSSFNDIGGVPVTGSRRMLTDILRGEMRFKGLVVSDFNAEQELVAHGYARDDADAVLKALTAGCDVSLDGGHYLKHIPALVSSGRLPVRVVDEAVRRVLRVKAALGLFENPYRSLGLERRASDIRRPETLALAREAGRKSIVLLKNTDDLLPLPKSGKTIALIGPFVSDRRHVQGTWMIFPDPANAVTLEEGVRAQMSDPARLLVAPGCGVERPLAGGLEAAVAAARAADVVVLHIGESTDMTGEAASRTEIGIPAVQRDLVEAVAATGKPLVVLLKHGRALELTGAVKGAQAIVCTWFLGSESGHAIADVVFGDHAPQGRLPVSFPQSSGQQPYYYNHRSTGRPQTGRDPSFKARYRDAPNAALYPFGHGLGYASVAYGATQVSRAVLEGAGTLRVSAAITNTGARPAHEVAQLYIHDRVASLVQPVRVLKGLRHLDLAPGETQTVVFELRAADLAFVRTDETTAAEPGDFQVWIAPNAVDGVPATFVLGDR